MGRSENHRASNGETAETSVWAPLSEGAVTHGEEAVHCIGGATRPLQGGVERRIFGLENEYGVTCTLRGQRRLSPDEVARYLFRRVVSLGPLQQRLPRERRPALPRRRQPPRVRHARVRLDPRPRDPRQGGERILEGLVQSAEQRLREEGIRGEVFLFKNNTDSAGNSYGCHENYLVETRRRLLEVHRRADPVPREPPDLRRRGQGAADRARRHVLHRAARRAHLGGRVVGHHAVAADHQHPRRAARRRRALPPAARDRRRLEHERVHDLPQGRRHRRSSCACSKRTGRRGATSRSRTRSARSARSATTSPAAAASASPTAASCRRSRSSPSTSTARSASPSAKVSRSSSSRRSRCGNT